MMTVCENILEIYIINEDIKSVVRHVLSSMIIIGVKSLLLQLTERILLYHLPF